MCGATSSDVDDSDDDIDFVAAENEVREDSSSSDESSDEDESRPPARKVWKPSASPPSNSGAQVLETGCRHDPSKGTFTPGDYFRQYFASSMYETLAEKTNIRILERNGTIAKVTRQEVQHFFGISMLMSTTGYPRLRYYWKAGLGVQLIINAMARDRFFRIRSNLTCTTEIEVPDAVKKEDRLWKVKPFVTMIRDGCLSLLRLNCFSIDEQMVPFTGRTSLKQYVPNKPHPIGLKNFVLAGQDGLVYDFHLYQGKSTFPDYGLGVSGNSVVHLCQTIPQDSTLYFDRWFTSVPLLETLLRKKIFATGTIMKNRIPKTADLASDKELAKESRGKSDAVLKHDGSLSITKWYDKKAVTLASTAFGVEPVGTCQRYSKQEHRKVAVPRPMVVQKYNEKMGGVDLCDRMMSFYSQRRRTSRWTLRTMIHLVDLACVNAWIEYRANKKYLKQPAMQYIEFKISVAESLLSTILEEDSNSSDEDTVEVPRKRVKPLPSLPVRTSQALHMPKKENIKNAARCRNPGCSKKTRHRCTSCDIYLCIETDRHCFFDFHTKK